MAGESTLDRRATIGLSAVECRMSPGCRQKAMARSRKRAEKGLCTQEESDAFCEKSEAALKNYLDKQVKEGTITPAERKALGR